MERGLAAREDGRAAPVIETFQAIYMTGCRAPKCDVAVSSNPVRLYCAEHADDEQMFALLRAEVVYIASFTITRAMHRAGMRWRA